jgi:hypothetical protein
MLALEHSRRQQPFPFSCGMESVFHDPYLSQSMNTYTSFDSGASFASIPFSFYDSNTLTSEAPPDATSIAMFASRSNSSFNPSSPHSELPPPTLSNASAASIPSNNSSTVGSPYSAHAQAVSSQDSWSSSNTGLALGSTILSNDNYDQGFGGVELESEMRFSLHGKMAEDFVGESNFSSVPNRPATSASSGKPQSSGLSPKPAMVEGSVAGDCVTIDAVLARASSAITPSLFHSSARCQSLAVSSSTPTESSQTTSQPPKAVIQSPSNSRSPTQVSKAPSFSSQSFSSATSALAHASNSGNPPINMSSFDTKANPTTAPYASRFHSHFFAQSTGNFMPPLESSCSFFLSDPSSHVQCRSCKKSCVSHACSESALDFRLLTSLHSDPALIQPTNNSYPDTTVAYPSHTMYHPHAMYGVNSATPSPNPSHPDQLSQNYAPTHLSPEMSSHIFYNNYQHAPYLHRRASVTSLNSRQSRQSPMSASADFDSETQEKGRCPHPDCGRVFKDLKAHMLTHQSERPEKCPILNCEYNQKGFARKYDKNRHTLTHYKGTMVCGFCPGSGSSVEKSFNRADVFKRHLTSVHGVEQNPPNSRKRSPGGANKKATNYCQDATGKCSTCSATFSNAQDFYEHLDDCVLRVVQQEEPSEAINQQHLAEIAADEAVKATMERNMLTNTEETVALSAEEEDDEEDDEDEDDDDEDDPSYKARSGKGMVKSAKPTQASRAVLNGGISKSTRSGRNGLTFSKGGVPLVGKGRRKRKHYPVSWGISADKMKMRKRVLCVYDGERRLWKDDMMLNNEFEVRMNLADGKSYFTDLDVETLKRADAIHGSTEEERGPWMQEEVQGFNLEELMS